MLTKKIPVVQKRDYTYTEKQSSVYEFENLSRIESNNCAIDELPRLKFEGYWRSDCIQM